MDLYHRAPEEGGHEPQPVAVHAHGYVAETDEQAVADFYAPYARAMSGIGRERGWGPMTPEQFSALRSQSGSLFVGTPDYVASKIADIRDTLGLDRFMLHTSVGTIEHEKVLRNIDLLGTKVAPPRYANPPPTNPPPAPQQSSGSRGGAPCGGAGASPCGGCGGPPPQIKHSPTPHFSAARPFNRPRITSATSVTKTSNVVLAAASKTSPRSVAEKMVTGNVFQLAG